MLLPFVIVFSASPSPSDLALFLTVAAKDAKDAWALGAQRLISSGYPNAQMLGVWDEAQYNELTVLFQRARVLTADTPAS